MKLAKNPFQEGTYGGQCVAWIKKIYDTYNRWPDFSGDAQNIKPNATEPALGAAVLTVEPIGHAAVIVGIEGDELVLAESNYNGDERVSVGRRLRIGDPRIRGYFIFE